MAKAKLAWALVSLGNVRDEPIFRIVDVRYTAVIAH